MPRTERLMSHDPTVEMSIVDKVGTDGVIYRNNSTQDCYVLDKDLTKDGRPLTKKQEHEFVKNVIKYGKREVFKKMMKSKMKLKLHDLIYLACLYGQIEIVKDMIDHQGSDFEPNKDTKYGFKPIEIAALNGMNDIVDLLIENHAEINYETLKNAVVGGHLETVEKLVENWHLEPISDEDLMGLEIRQRQHMNVDELRVVGEEKEKKKIMEFLQDAKNNTRFYSRASI